MVRVRRFKGHARAHLTFQRNVHRRRCSVEQEKVTSQRHCVIWSPLPLSPGSCFAWMAVNIWHGKRLIPFFQSSVGDGQNRRRQSTKVQREPRLMHPSQILHMSVTKTSLFSMIWNECGENVRKISHLRYRLIFRQICEVAIYKGKIPTSPKLPAQLSTRMVDSSQLEIPV